MLIFERVERWREEASRCVDLDFLLETPPDCLRLVSANERERAIHGLSPRSLIPRHCKEGWRQEDNVITCDTA